jgi:hypothetical protein
MRLHFRYTYILQRRKEPEKKEEKKKERRGECEAFKLGVVDQR